MLHHCNIMCNEKEGSTAFLLDIHQQIYHCRLNAYVQSGDRFVGCDEYRITGKSAGNAYPLPLPA